MRTFNLILCFLVTASINSLAQQAPQVREAKFDYQWIIAEGKYYLDFNANPPAVIATPDYADMPVSNYTYSSICDTNGQLLIATNGHRIIDKTYKYMAGKDSINRDTYGWNNTNGNGDLVPQGALILPKPESQDIYYIISTPITGQPTPNITNNNYIRYSTVIFNADYPNGKVTQINQSIVAPDSLNVGMMTACRHANGRDWWILVHREHHNQFITLLLDPTGIHEVFRQAVGTNVPEIWGQAVFSPDGNKYAFFGTYYPLSPNGAHCYLNIYDFDRCTGHLSNPQQYDFIMSGSSSFGCAISPNSKYLYFSGNTGLYQLDMDNLPIAIDTSIKVSPPDMQYDTISGVPFGIGPFFMQLAPNNKIYVQCSGVHLGVINQPDEAGFACQVQYKAVSANGYVSFSPTNFPNFRLGPVDGSVCDTLGLDEVTGVGSLPDKPHKGLGLQVYPNPANDVAAIMWLTPNLDGQMYITISNMYGQTVGQQRVNAADGYYELSLNTLPNGIYMVSLQSDSQTGLNSVSKLVVSH